jgi:hypothetical protein
MSVYALHRTLQTGDFMTGLMEAIFCQFNEAIYFIETVFALLPDDVLTISGICGIFRHTTNICRAINKKR